MMYCRNEYTKKLSNVQAIQVTFKQITLSFIDYTSSNDWGRVVPLNILNFMVCRRSMIENIVGEATFFVRQGRGALRKVQNKEKKKKKGKENEAQKGTYK